MSFILTIGIAALSMATVSSIQTSPTIEMGEARKRRYELWKTYGMSPSREQEGDMFYELGIPYPIYVVTVGRLGSKQATIRSYTRISRRPYTMRFPIWGVKIYEAVWNKDKTYRYWSLIWKEERGTSGKTPSDRLIQEGHDLAASLGISFEFDIKQRSRIGLE